MILRQLKHRHRLAYSLTVMAMTLVSLTAQVNFTSSNLPIVVIDTYGQEIVDDPRVVVHMGIIDNGPGVRNNLTDPYNGYDGLIAIELRGSSSSIYPKKQYRFETQDIFGENLNISLLGMPAENDWVFYGPYDDQSLIRNVLAYRISNETGRYASRTRFCEIMIDGDYRGLYVLMEKIKRDANRVDIASMDGTDVSGDALSGGYIIKIDKFEGETAGAWQSANGITYQYHYPKPAEIVPAQETYIQNYISDFEAVMNSPFPADSSNGYPSLLAVDSFVDHFLISEFAKNVDAYRISTFMYKKRDSNGGKLHAGPIWDFNLSFGKAWYPEDLFLTSGWQVNYNDWRPWDSYQVPFWWEILSSDTYFKNLAIDRWQELRSGVLSLDSLYGRIDTMVVLISEARNRNFIRWPGSVGDHGYEDEIIQLKGWINMRLNWIDNNIQYLSIDENETAPHPVSIQLHQNYPNPFNPITTIAYELGIKANVQLTVFDLLGNQVAILVSNTQAPGKKVIQLDASKMASGIYFYQLSVGDPSNISQSSIVLTRRMAVIK